MDRFRLWHILLWGLISPVFLASFAPAKNSDAAVPRTKQLPAPDTPTGPLRYNQSYQRWLDQDVVYIITDEERADFAKLETDQQRDKFIEDFWERRNPNPTLEANPFKEEHYRRIAHTNRNFAAGVAGWKSDRGRIYIIYGPPDEREGHPADTNPNLPPDASLTRRYRTDIWRYNFIQGLGRNVFFDFIDKCGCGEFQLNHDPTKTRAPSTNVEEKLISVKQAIPEPWRKWLNEDVRWIVTDEERAEFRGLRTDRRREAFVNSFWERRNPNPGSTENTFKEEYYRRLAYVKEQFAAGVPGFKTDRGRIYVRYGAPDQIEQHFSAAGSKKASDLFGIGAIPYDWELWHYRYIEGIGEGVGKDVTLEFVDTCGCGRYEMPIPKEALNKYEPR